MKKGLYALIIGLMLVGAMSGCEKQASEKNKKPETIADTKELIDVKCSACHFSSRIFEKKQPKKRWVNIVNRMRAMNTDMISKEEMERIINYLQENNSLEE